MTAVCQPGCLETGSTEPATAGSEPEAQLQPGYTGCRMLDMVGRPACLQALPAEPH